MATYAVGDIQGCYDALRNVLDQVGFDPECDTLWCVGDIVNRGPKSLESLRLIKSLGDAAITVLGNHDLHLLAIAYGGHKLKRKDTLEDIFSAPDAEELLTWLKRQPLVYFDPGRNILVAHAGIPHIWSFDAACQYADEVSEVLRGPEAGAYFQAMYGDQPEIWHDSLTGMDRLRVITNYLTRMRFISREGALELNAKNEPENAPEGYVPWYSLPRSDNGRIVFGHWAALQGSTGSERFMALDTGCVWGGCLTLVNIDTGEKVACEC
ncbi:diadenosine tetraphosphatase [Oleiphilus messinensis]|uniref:bis(5'-nucleosyl)-tetraphosphatase (symmetrical) n=1 Tax=Oleiphilus messinensis TaxID=141451 RepID=A0A1Y0IDA7_9GAMM|nr:symmetrical bis(5'-nucleosyl)-tetraphosphatase [Oleiphilus messinensis]ARU58517.1 diadenosine tetraphosphatase [Oleiphilus messinensis]